MVLQGKGDGEVKLVVKQTRSFPKQPAGKDTHVVIELQRVFKGKSTGIGWTTVPVFKTGPGGDMVLNEGKHLCSFFKTPIGTPSYVLSELQATEVRNMHVGLPAVIKHK